MLDQPKRLALPGLLAALALAPAPAPSASESGNGRAVVVTPLTLVNTGPLRFGNIIPSGAAGTVTINQLSGTRSATGGATLAGGLVGRASFTGMTGGFGLVQVVVPTAPVTLTRPGGGSMIATLTLGTVPGLPILALGPNNRVHLIGTGTVFNFAVGGTLNVGANQPSGVYTGTFTVTANYY
jgi:spore coat protein U-like protein